MIRHLRHLCAVAVSTLILTAASAAAQTPPPQTDQLQFEPTIKGAPYSGEAVTTVKLVMFDGTHIERTLTAKYYRDNEGRVRREQTIMGLEALDPANDVRAVVLIIDPVSDSLYSLIPGSNTAQRLSISMLRKRSEEHTSELQSLTNL